MKTFFELIVIASTLFIFVACNQSVANENPVGSVVENVVETPVVVEEAPPMDSESIPKTLLSFSEMVHDFGVIEEGEKVTHTFNFQNTGDEPLIINSAKGSCGCTVPQFPKEPIAPGASGEIVVKFDSKGRVGNQTKTVTINANTNPNPTRLTIKAQVEKAVE